MNNHDKIKQAFSSLKAPDDMAEKVIKRARGEAPARTRRTYNIGRVAIVALICVLTTVTVFAAIPGLLKIGKSFWNKDVVVSEAGVYPISEEFRKYINANEWKQLDKNDPDSYSLITDYPNNPLRFSSLDESAAFFGMQFPANMLLSEFAPNDREPIKSHIMYNEKNDNAYVDLFADCMLDTGEIIIVQYRFYCGISNDESVAFRRGNHTGFDEELNNIQNYISSVNGIEAILYTDDSINYAMFSLNDVSYTLSDVFFDYSENNAYNIFEEIIDSFE